MSNEFESALEKVDAAIAEMKRQDIKLGPVETAVENLRKHSSNIQLLADRTDAIRDEIISPVKAELRKANWIGILLGILGILLTLGFSIYAIRSQTPQSVQATPQHVEAPPIVQISAPEDISALLQQIAANVRTMAIGQFGIDSDYKPAESEKKVLAYTEAEVMKSDNHSVSFFLVNPHEEEVKDHGLMPFIQVRISIDGQPLSVVGMREYLTIESPNGTVRFEGDYANLSEGDSLYLADKSGFTVLRVLRKATKMLTRGDKEDGAVFKFTERASAPSD